MAYALVCMFFFFFKQKTAYEMRISDWSSDVCSSDLNTFRVCGRDDQQGIVAGDYILAHYKGKKVAILHDKTAYGQGLAEETRKRLNAKGMKETMFEGITPGEKDYSALVSKMKAAGIDLIYLGGYHPEGGQIGRAHV